MQNNTELYDFIVIGSGPAGSTVAIKLTRLGYKVLVFERTKFPRAHEGESLLPFCYPIFEELGVLDEMKRNFVRKPGARFTSHDGEKSSTWCFRTVIHDDSYLSFNVERARFDKILMDNARKNGVTIMEETKVETVDLAGEDKIVTVTTVGADGEKNSWQAKMLIDASGQDTFLAKRQGVKNAHKELDRVAWLGHWKGANFAYGLESGLINIIYLENSKKGWFALQPVGKDMVSATLVVDRAYMKEQKKLLSDSGSEDWQKEFYLKEINNCPVTKKVLENADMARRFLIVSDYSYFSDIQYGDNFALIGDSYKFLDPIFSTGVYLGMKSAMLYADAIHTKLTKGREEGDEVLKGVFERIQGAYSLVEKFINIYYDPSSLNLSEVSAKSESGYDGFEAAFALIHYLLAGDFFYNYEKYATFLDMIKDQSQFGKWKNLVVNKMETDATDCTLSYEDIFGDIMV